MILCDKKQTQPSERRIKTNNNNSENTLHRNDKIISILTSIHTIRIFGVVFLIGTSEGIIAPTFGYVAGIGDILIGVTAIPIAYIIKKGYSWARRGSMVWNILGMADLIAAIYLGVTTSQFSAATSATMTTWPWILILTLGVPSLVTTHIATLWFLRKNLLLGKRKKIQM
jgi:hypothetical protein